MNKDDELFYDKPELGTDVEGFMADENLLKKFRNTFGSGDGLAVFEYIIDRICNTFDIDIKSERAAYKKEVGLEIWELAMKADVDICISFMRKLSLKHQTEKIRVLNEMKGSGD
jgi:hypothetical protein